MESPESRKRALGLFGGGLDSRLAFRMMRDAAIDVRGVYFDTGFARPAHREQALGAAERGELEVVDVAQRYLDEVVAAPRFGYGSGMNPCHDCRAFMLARADEIAGAAGIELVFTGDVVGQRAHDQSHEAFRIADREAGVEGRVLRPLSAKHLDPVEAGGPARDLQGRSRRAQLALAEAWGETGFPTPSGRCCRLADPAFARRMRDYLEHRSPKALRAEDIPWLAVGRHFRLGWDLKVVLSRNAEEARRISALAPSTTGRAAPHEVPGPSGWIECGALDDAAAGDVAALVACHTAAGKSGKIDISIEIAGEARIVRSGPASEARVARWRI